MQRRHTCVATKTDDESTRSSSAEAEWRSGGPGAVTATAYFWISLLSLHFLCIFQFVCICILKLLLFKLVMHVCEYKMHIYVSFENAYLCILNFEYWFIFFAYISYMQMAFCLYHYTCCSAYFWFAHLAYLHLLLIFISYISHIICIFCVVKYW